MAKYIAYKESGNLINDAVAKCINEGVCSGVTAPATDYITPVVANTTNITFSGAYLGLLNTTNNIGKTGTLILGVSSVAGGRQTFQYPLSTLNDVIYSNKVDRTVIDTTTVNNSRGVYFKFPTPITINSNYSLYYRVSVAGTSIDAKYYGIIGNPSTNLLNITTLLTSDEVVIAPHIKNDGTYVGPNINGSGGLTFSCFYFTIEKDCTFNLQTSPYTFTINKSGWLNITDGGTLNLSAQLPTKGSILLGPNASIALNGGVLSANATYVSPSASLLTSTVANAASFTVTNSNDIKNWISGDTILFTPQKQEGYYRTPYTVTSVVGNVLSINAVTSAYNINNRLKDINYDIINLNSNIIINSTLDKIEEPLINSNFEDTYKNDFPRRIFTHGNSILNCSNVLFKNLGYVTAIPDAALTLLRNTTNPMISHSIRLPINITQFMDSRTGTPRPNTNTYRSWCIIELEVFITAYGSVNFLNKGNLKGDGYPTYVYSGIGPYWGLPNNKPSWIVHPNDISGFIDDNGSFAIGVDNEGCAVVTCYETANTNSYATIVRSGRLSLNQWHSIGFHPGWGKLYVDGVEQGQLRINPSNGQYKWNPPSNGAAAFRSNNINTRIRKLKVTSYLQAYPDSPKYSYSITDLGNALPLQPTNYVFNSKNNTNNTIFNLNGCKFTSKDSPTDIFSNTIKIKNFDIKNCIFHNSKINFQNVIDESTVSNNILLDTNISLTNITQNKLKFDNNSLILKLNNTNRTTTEKGTQISIENSHKQEGLIENCKIHSCIDNTAITYTPANYTNNTLTLSNIKIYNDISTSNSKGLSINKASGVTYNNPVNITMKDCDITGKVELNVCNGLIDLKDSIIKQKNIAEDTLVLNISSQNTLINVDNLTCFKGTNTEHYGLVIYNESGTTFSKPQKISIKNSTIYGGIYYNSECTMAQNCLYKLPQNTDDYSINIFNNNIYNNYVNPSWAISLNNLWPTQVVNISGIKTYGVADKAIYCHQIVEKPLAGILQYPYNVNIQNCNLSGFIQLNYDNLKYNKFDGSDKNRISGTSYQKILSTNISNHDYGIEIINPNNPRLHIFIDNLNYTPVNINSGNIVRTTYTLPKNTLNPYQLTLKNSILTAGQLNIDNFYGDITNNIISLSTFDNNITVGDGPVTIKNNKALVNMLSTDDFIKSDNKTNYSYNLNSNGSYSKVEVKSVSSYRLDSINPTTTDIYDSANFINGRIGVTLASAATGLKYEIRTINSGIVALTSSTAGNVFSTFSLNSKFNFIRFKAVSNSAVRAKMFLNEKMIYCGNIISYPNFIINMREFEWDKKDTFHVVMYTPANNGVTLSAFEYSDNGAEYQPLALTDIGFYNKLSHNLITKFKTIHPRKNNKGNYNQLYVDETIESPEYDNSVMPSLIVDQNIIKTGSNIILGKIDSKYIINGSNGTANLINPKSTQYFYNGDMTLLNDGKYISSEFDGNLVDTGAPSERVVPRAYLNGGINHPYRTKSSSKYVALSAGEYAKVFVFVAKTEGYSTNPINAPRLVLAKNVALGIQEDTILDKFNNDIMIDKKFTDWVLLQGTTPAVTKTGVLEFYVDCAGDNMSGSGYINVDSWSASTDNNIGEYWFSDNGETDWNAV